MHFKRVANTVNRPHFIGERDGEIHLLNFCQDHKTMKCRKFDFPPEESSSVMGGFGASVFGMPRQAPRGGVPKIKENADFQLEGNTRHGLGATAGKVYFLDDSPRGETTSMWRVDCETGHNEYTKIPSGFLTRFTDSEYCVVAKFRDSKQASIYKWMTNGAAEFIKAINMPSNVNDHTRIAYGSKLMFLKVEEDKILITSLDVITEQVVQKNLSLNSIGDPTVRWICAKDHLLAVLSGRVVYIEIHSLAMQIAPTNLDATGKYHPFAVDSKGFVYVLQATTEGSTVQRAKESMFAELIEDRIVIPKVEKVKVQKQSALTNDKYINVHFRVTYRGNTLLDQSMKMLNSKPLGDVIRRSPEIVQPQNTRLKIFYKNEEVLTFRTTYQLQMKDGEEIYAEFIDKDIGDYDEVRAIEQQKEKRKEAAHTPGFFSPEMLDELRMKTERTKPKKKEVPRQKSTEKPQGSNFADQGASASMSRQGVASERPSQQEPMRNENDVMSEDGDNGKWKTAVLQLDITNFTMFCRGNPDTEMRFSKPVSICGLKWRILARVRYVVTGRPQAGKALAFFLQCIGSEERDGANWSCLASAELQVLSKSPSQETHIRRINHTFNSKEHDWGYSSFMTCDQLANPANGFIKNDTISLQVIMRVEGEEQNDQSTSSNLAPQTSGIAREQAATNAPRAAPAIPPAPAAVAANIPASEPKPDYTEKLLTEMEWLRTYISGNGVKREDGKKVNELELLKKKYARMLMMMGRAEVLKE